MILQQDPDNESVKVAVQDAYEYLSVLSFEPRTKIFVLDISSWFLLGFCHIVTLLCHILYEHFLSPVSSVS